MTGTEVALFDYARYNEEVLGNKSIIIYREKHPSNHPEAVKKFTERFEVFPYQDNLQIDPIVKHTGTDLLYMIKSGRNDGLLSMHVPTMVHAVFPTAPHHIHGASYAFISEWLSKNCSNKLIPAVPHIVSMPDIDDDLRQRLNIPKTSLVLGGYGGQDSFDVKCAINAVHSILQNTRETYFLFMNFNKFINHPRAIFLPGTTDILEKTRFINTCDAMLHARQQGESFGLACGEFSVRNKPVITYRFCKHTHHIDVLGSKGLLYEDEPSLVKIIKDLPQLLQKNKNWDAYTPICNPQIVMAAFDRHLIYPALQNPRKDIPDISIGPKEIMKYYLFKWRMHA